MSSRGQASRMIIKIPDFEQINILQIIRELPFAENGSSLVCANYVF